MATRSARPPRAGWGSAARRPAGAPGSGRDRRASAGCGGRGWPGSGSRAPAAASARTPPPGCCPRSDRGCGPAPDPAPAAGRQAPARSAPRARYSGRRGVRSGRSRAGRRRAPAVQRPAPPVAPVSRAGSRVRRAARAGAHRRCLSCGTRRARPEPQPSPRALQSCSPSSPARSGAMPPRLALYEDRSHLRHYGWRPERRVPARSHGSSSPRFLEQQCARSLMPASPGLQQWLPPALTPAQPDERP